MISSPWVLVHERNFVLELLCLVCGVASAVDITRETHTYAGAIDSAVRSVRHFRAGHAGCEADEFTMRTIFLLALGGANWPALLREQRVRLTTEREWHWITAELAAVRAANDIRRPLDSRQIRPYLRHLPHRNQ